MSSFTSVGTSLEQFAAAQRERLEQIRRATEHEQALLSGAQLPTREGGLSSSVSPRRGSTADGATDGSTAASISRSRVDHRQDDREAMLQQMADKLTRDDAVLRDEEKKVDGRLQRAEEMKRQLLSQLVALQYREQELKSRSAVLDEDEMHARAQQDEVRLRMRELSHQSQAIEHDISERRAKFEASKTRLDVKQQEQHRVVQRLRQQQHEHDDRIRSLEWQVAAKMKACDDLEREQSRAEVAQRDAELAAIEELRQDIQRTKALLHL